MLAVARRGSACLARHLASRQQCVRYTGSPLPSASLSVPHLAAVRHHQTLAHRCTVIIQRKGVIVRLFSASKKVSTKRRAVAANPQSITMMQKRIKDGVLYLVGIAVFMFGLCFACVPLYKIFCSATGFGGTTQHDKSEAAAKKIEDMESVRWRPITVKFAAHVDSKLQWEFTPVQEKVHLVPGETCLAFFTAKNLTDRPITGVSVYNVLPFTAGIYFNKIQCFCFDEQRLNPYEEIDMPVFFYIDPEFALDVDLIDERCTEVQLHYIFFDTAQNEELSRFDKFVNKVKRKILPEWLIGEDYEKYRPGPDTDLHNPVSH